MAEPRSDATQILGARIRSVRTQIGISQMDLGELCGIHFTNVAKIERGEVNPTLFTIIRLASALEVDPAALVKQLHVEQIPEVDHQMTASDFVQARLEEERARRAREAAG